MAFNFEVNPVAINNISKTLENLSKSLKLQDKTVEIDSNGQEIVTADSEYDGLGKVTINTDVPTKPEEVLTETITENGLKTFNPTAGSVFSSASITVNVPEKKIEAEKTVNITENKETVITPTPDNEGMARVVVTTNVPQPTLEENKTQTISSNSVVEVTPSAGNDGMKKATITVNVPEKKIEANKTQSIVTNGETVITPTAGNDGMAKVTVNVNVPTGGTEYRTSKGIAFPKFLDGSSAGLDQQEIVNNLILDSEDVSYTLWYGNSLNYEGYVNNKILTVSPTFDFSEVEIANNFLGGNYLADNIGINNSTMTLNNCQKLTSAKAMFYMLYGVRDLWINDQTQPVDYSYAFAESSVQSLYGIGKISSADHMFYQSKIVTVSDLTVTGIEGNAKMNSMFYNCDNLITSPKITIEETASNIEMDYMFYGGLNLITVGLITLPTNYSTLNLNSIFSDSTFIETIEGFVNLKDDLDLSPCQNLSNASIQNLIDNAADVTSLGTRTMTFNATPFATITEEQRAAATAKGWTLASA